MDLTVIAIPGYFSSMGAEYLYLKRRAATEGAKPSDYERQDTIASLTMGTASLIAPLVFGKLLAPVTPGKGKYGKGDLHLMAPFHPGRGGRILAAGASDSGKPGAGSRRTPVATMAKPGRCVSLPHAPAGPRRAPRKSPQGPAFPPGPLSPERQDQTCCLACWV